MATHGEGEERKREEGGWRECVCVREGEREEERRVGGVEGRGVTWGVKWGGILRGEAVKGGGSGGGRGRRSGGSVAAGDESVASA